MRKKAMIWLAVYTGGLGMSFVKGPIIALSTYMWSFYSMYTSWAKGLHGRWSLYVSLTLLTSYVLKHNSMKKMSHMKNPQMKWLILILINMILITPFAVSPNDHKATIIEYAKLMLLYYLIVNTIREKKDFKLLIVMILIGNLILGWEAYTNGKYIAGRLENIGAPGIQGSNYLANHLLLIIPHLAIAVLFGKKRERIIGIIAGPFVLNMLVGCNSRGAFLAFGAMMGFGLVLMKKWMRLQILIGLLLAVIGFMLVGGVERVMARLETVQSYEEDGSATGRLVAWKAAVVLSQDYPLGAGGDGFKALSPVYTPELVAIHDGQKRTIHNTYLMILTNWGYQGLFLFFIFYISNFSELFKIRKRTGTFDDKFYYLQSYAITLGMLGFLLAATFGNRIYAEGYYWFSALTVALSNIQQSELKDNAHCINED